MWFWIGMGGLALACFIGLHVLAWYLAEKYNIYIVVESEHMVDEYKLYHCKFTQGDKTEARSYVLTQGNVNGVYQGPVFSWPKVQRIDEAETFAVLKAYKSWLDDEADREKISDIKNKFGSMSYRKSA